jgi:hypothetical protein
MGFDDTFLSVAFPVGPFHYGIYSSAWDNSMCALGSKTVSLKHFISFQNLSQWLYIRASWLGSDYWIYYAPNKPHNVNCHGSQYHESHSKCLSLGEGYRD